MRVVDLSESNGNLLKVSVATNITSGVDCYILKKMYLKSIAKNPLLFFKVRILFGVLFADSYMLLL